MEWAWCPHLVLMDLIWECGQILVWVDGVVRIMVVGELGSLVMGRKLCLTINMVRWVTIEQVGQMPWRKKIEVQKGTGLGLLIEGIEMIEIQVLIGKCLEKRIWAMTLTGQKEGIAMIEILVENGIGSAIVTESIPGIVTVTVRGIVIESVTVIGTEKAEISMLIIIGTGTGK
jgi:hypothetical protein